MDQKLITAASTGALVLWVVYRRMRRNIGRQPVKARRMRFRIGLLAVFAAMITLAALHRAESLGALLFGVAAGAALGGFALSHTKFERTTEGAFYTPHTYVGLFVSALLISRIAYRLLAVYPAALAAAQADQNPFAAYQRSPLTLWILGVVLGYYVLYYIGVLKKSEALPVATDDA